MSGVLQLRHLLTTPPSPISVAGLRLRHYAGTADLAGWLLLREQAFARERLGVRQWSAADFEREFLQKPWWRPEQMWLAETDDARELVGTITLAMRGQGEAARPVVHWLAVLPSWRRRGVARWLTTTLEAAAWQAGYREVWLETHTQWRAAHAFYEALGYEKVTSGTP